jgi:hypothetical protein
VAKKNAFALFTVELGVATTDEEALDSLDGIDTRFLETGTFGWVKTGPAAATLLQLDTTAVAPPDGTTIIEPRDGPGRWLEFAGGGGPGACLTPRHHELYVDANTTTPPASQNGSLSCPYDTIGAALATIPAGDPADFDTLLPWVINIAPGIYPEAVSLPPSPGISVTLKGQGGAQPSIAPIVGPVTTMPGPGVFIGDPSDPFAHEMDLDYSGLDGTGGINDVPPIFVFENIATFEVEVDADGADISILGAAYQVWKDCVVATYEDISQTTKYNSVIELRNCTFDLVTGTGDATFDVEHSVGVDWSFINGLRADKSVFDVVDYDHDATGAPQVEAYDLTDCMVLTSIDESSGSAPPSIRMDAATAYMCALFGSITAGENRYTQDLPAHAFQHAVLSDPDAPTSGTFFMDNNISTFITTASAALDVRLPFLGGTGDEGWTIGGVGPGGVDRLSRQLVIKNRAGAAGSITVTASGGDTVEGGASFGPIAAGEGVVLVPRAGAPAASGDWEVVATVP